MRKTMQFSIMFILTVIVASFAQAGLLDRIGRPERPTRPVRPDRPDRIIFVTAGEVRVNKLIDDDFSFAPLRYDDRVLRIEVIATKASVRINSAVVIFQNGEVRNLHELTGHISEGRKLGAFINGRYIREIRINATSDNLIGSRGQFRIDLGIAR
jgi:hypothetical protein